MSRLPTPVNDTKETYYFNLGILVFLSATALLYFATPFFRILFTTVNALKKATVGELPDFLRNPKANLQKLSLDARQNETGVSVLSLGYIGGNYAIVAPQDQAEFEKLLNEIDSNPEARRSYASFKFFSGSSVFILSDTDHTALLARKNISAFLTPSSFIAPVMAQIQSLAGTQEIPLRETVCEIVRSVMFRNMLGVESLPKDTYKIMEAYRGDVQKWSTFFAPNLLSLFPSLRAKRDMYAEFSQGILANEFEKTVKTIQSNDRPETCNLIIAVMSVLIKSRNPHLESEDIRVLLKSLSKDEIRKYFNDPVIRSLPMILKAADNITDAISICIERLASHPTWHERLEAEIQSADLFSELTLDPTELRSLVFLDALFKESLRFDSPLAIARYTQSGFTYQGAKIPPKTMVLFDLEQLNRGAKYWENPNDFDPDRFLTEVGKQRKLGQFPLVPLSVGKRKCPAGAVSEILFKIFVGQIVHQYRFEAVKRTEGDITLRIHKKDLFSTCAMSSSIKF